MQWSDIQFDPPRSTLRQFAGLWLVFFAGLALWQAAVRRQLILAAIFAVLALTIGPLGLTRPRSVRPIYVGWMVLAFPIGWTISQIILAVLFFGLFAPVAVAFRLIGRDPLDRTRHPERKSYWVPKPLSADLRRYFKQF
jgi:hypothetical protein